jgi:hypothetical protein
MVFALFGRTMRMTVPIRAITLPCISFMVGMTACAEESADAGQLQSCEGWEHVELRGESSPLRVTGPSLWARVGEDPSAERVPVWHALPEPVVATWTGVEVSGDETELSFQTEEASLAFILEAPLQLPAALEGREVVLAPSGDGIVVTQHEDGTMLLGLHRWDGGWERVVAGDAESLLSSFVPATVDVGPFTLATSPSCLVRDGCPRIYVFYSVLVSSEQETLASIHPFGEAEVLASGARYRIDVHGAVDRNVDEPQCADLLPPSFDVDILWLGEDE